MLFVFVVVKGLASTFTPVTMLFISVIIVPKLLLQSVGKEEPAELVNNVKALVMFLS